MNIGAKKIFRHFVVGPSAVRVSMYRDSRTGRFVVDDIVSKTGRVVLKGGPITGGKNRLVLTPRGRTKFQTKRLEELVARMKLPA